MVFISVDQFRRDYIERYGARWTSGLARLVKDGAVFDQAAYPYFHTITCAGHATMSTGVYPATHGLPLNAWWDRASGREMACTDDGGAKAIGHRAGPKAPTGGHSAHLLRAPTLADVLRQQLTPTPRVVSMSMKPRAAIMLAGHAGDAVLWYTPEGGPTTSTAYAGAQIPFAHKFAQINPKPAELTGEWKKLLPDDAYQNEDDGFGEHPPEGWTNTFPHPLTQTRTDGRVMSYWQSTPAADTFLARLAMAAVDELKLGSEHLDYLAISFSELDTTGHAFGPDSHEVQDVLLRLDRSIGELLDHLDAKVGKGRYVVALTGDHGVAPLPERRKSRGEDGGRVNLKPLAIELDAALSARWGKGTYVSRILYTDIYFAPGVYARLAKDAEAMAEVVSIVERTPGVAKVVPDRSDRGGAGARRRSGAGGAALQPGARSQRRPVPRAAAVLDHEPHRDDAWLAAALRSTRCRCCCSGPASRAGTTASRRRPRTSCRRSRPWPACRCRRATAACCARR